MDERTRVSIIFMAGFPVAFLALLFATLGRKSRGFKWLCLFVALCGLIYEAGCLEFIAGIGADPSGTKEVNDFLGSTFLVAAIWTAIILVTSPAEKPKRQDKESDVE